MKLHVLVLLSLGLLSSVLVKAQCIITPVITPSSPILCPNSSDTLRTVQTYQTYQWYKNNVAIAGATNPSLPVDYFNDAGNNFSVFVTLDTCSGMSAQALVDGWVFLLPTVQSSGNTNLCVGDTEYLVLMPPYEVNIQWTNNGNPIPGANYDTLIVTQTGNYSVSGAPALCPLFQQQLGVTISLTFSSPPVPVISWSSGALSTPFQPNTMYQWYNGTTAIPGANFSSFTPTQSGNYSVTITDVNGCTASSLPWNWIVGIDDIVPPQFWMIQTAGGVYELGLEPMEENMICEVTDMTGRVILSQQINAGTTRFSVNLTQQTEGIYMFILQGENGFAGSLRVKR
jgi:peptidoglycan hydrolase-like protein with peptidoglycan-binding domain